VVDLADALLARHPAARWVAERELRRDSMATVRDGRRGQLLIGTPHVPDGVLIVPGGPVGGIAVELELSAKKADEYGRIPRWYAGALACRRVWWSCATAALERKIAELVDREWLDDFVEVWLLPAGARVGGEPRVGPSGRGARGAGLTVRFGGIGTGQRLGDPS
jgi:hypothetical protein